MYAILVLKNNQYIKVSHQIFEKRGEAEEVKKLINKKLEPMVYNLDLLQMTHGMSINHESFYETPSVID